MNMKVSCKLGDKTFSLSNPIMPGPGSYGNAIEFAAYDDLSKMGALVPNSMMIGDGQPSVNNKFARTSCGYISAFGPNNISLNRFIVEVLGKLPQGVPIIVDLKSRNMEEMAAMAAVAAQESRITAIEVNLNCPYASPEPPYWPDSAQLEKLMRMVKEQAGDKPVIAKGPGGLYSLPDMIRSLEAAGTDLFVPFNCITGMYVDIRTGVQQGGGYFGPGVKPIGVAVCRQAASISKMPIIGAGGITCAADVIEYIMAGAFAVQVGSANLSRPDFLGRLVDELADLMAHMGIESLNEIRGSAHPLKTKLF